MNDIYDLASVTKITAPLLGLMKLVDEGKFGQMVALQGNEIVSVNLKEAVAKLKLVDESWWNLAKVFFK